MQKRKTSGMVLQADISLFMGGDEGMNVGKTTGCVSLPFLLDVSGAGLFWQCLERRRDGCPAPVFFLVCKWSTMLEVSDDEAAVVPHLLLSVKGRDE